jgi:hypothetical protein
MPETRKPFGLLPTIYISDTKSNLFLNWDRSEVLEVATIKIIVLWHVTPCSLVDIVNIYQTTRDDTPEACDFNN